MVTTVEVKDELAFGSDAVGLDDATFDSLISSLIARETERVEDAIDVSLDTQTVTESLARPEHVNEHDLPLPARPVQSVASVSVDTDRVGGEAVSSDDYRVDDAYIELLPTADRDGWPSARRSITVEWTHGYAEVPPMVRKAVTRLVRARLRAIDEDGIESDSLLGDSISYEPEESVIARARGDALEADEPEYYGGAGIV